MVELVLALVVCVAVAFYCFGVERGRRERDQ